MSNWHFCRTYDDSTHSYTCKGHNKSHNIMCRMGEKRSQQTKRYKTHSWALKNHTFVSDDVLFIIYDCVRVRVRKWVFVLMTDCAVEHWVENHLNRIKSERKEQIHHFCSHVLLTIFIRMLVCTFRSNRRFYPLIFFNTKRK